MAARVAIIGARGVGRHHARWWTLEGAEVCAIAGVSEETVAEARALLQESIGFRGRGYTDLGRLLREESPDFVDVCSPHPCHAEHVRAGLEAGCHVLCEKPFVFDPAVRPAELLAQARALITLAEEHGRQLAVCTQYAVAARIFRRLLEPRHGGAITRYAGRLEAPAKDRAGDPSRIWTDLAPHVLSVLLALYPEAEPRWETLERHFDGYEAAAVLTLRVPGQSDVACEFHTRNRTEPPTNIRQFSFDGDLFDVQADRDEEGVFRARIVTPWGTESSDDFLRLLIRDSLYGVPTAQGPAALKNLDWMLRILGAQAP